jgi:hypothetical protein
MLLLQVALLIADRAKLIEEIEVLRKLKFSEVNGMNKEGELLSEVIKVHRDSSEIAIFEIDFYDVF